MRKNFKQILSCVILVALTFAVPGISQDLVFENDFDQHTTAKLYESDDLDADWSEPIWEDGVREERVSIVTGADAFGGEGSSLAVAYPADVHGTKLTGAQWQLDLGAEYEEATLTYRLKFAEGFDFVRGGKLPGLAGGSAPSGSEQATGFNGWTGRLMWRTDFDGTSGDPQQLVSQAISYAKHVNSGFDGDGVQEDKEYLEDANGDPIQIDSGVWYKITQRVKMNDPTEANGVLQIWVDDQLVLDRSDIRFRKTSKLKIDMVYFSTFFGGNSDWKTSKDEIVFFDDFEVTAATPRFIKVPDHYPTIQEALDAANPEDTVAVRGTHTVNLILDKNIRFRGYTGTKLIVDDPNQPVITVATSDVQVKRLEIEGGSEGVLVLSGNEGVRINDVDIQDAQRGISVQADCHNLLVRKCDISFCELEGVRVTGVTNAKVIDCECIRNGDSGFTFFDVHDLVLEGCVSKSNGAMGFGVLGDDAYLFDNKSINNPDVGFWLTGDNMNVVDNESRSSGLHGFNFGSVSDGTMVDNYSRNNKQAGFVWAQSCSRNSIIDNLARRNQLDGYVIGVEEGNSLSSNNVLEFNVADDNGGNGFYCGVQSALTEVLFNHSEDNDLFGYVDRGQDNFFNGNSCDDNGSGSSDPPGICDD
jgi:nitrous oxidase accessory protein NosD